MNRFLPALAFSVLSFTSLAQEAKDPKPLNFQSGEVVLGDKLVNLNLGENFRFLDKKDTDTVLQKWGNPPGFDGLGMLVPKSAMEGGRDTWTVVMTYEADGYISDEDADKIDSKELLQSMQESIKASRPERQKQGYPTYELVGWAEEPQYDKTSHILYWAKQIHFDDRDQNTDTLNYNIRVLGRKGVLNLNVVSSMDALPEVIKHRDEILQVAHFMDGYRYDDYKPGTDKIAAYGLAALVAGGALAKKAGFFKLLLMGLVASKKLLVVGFLGVAAFFKRLLGRKGP